MKKGFLLVLMLGIALICIRGIRAEVLTGCFPTVEIVNQDPYPANPGEYVKVVFQIDGLNNPACKDVSFELKESFPFTMDPDQTKIYEFVGSVYARDFKSTALTPYKLRVDRDAIDGDNQIEGILKHTNLNGEIISQVEQFQINVKGVKIDFDVSVRDFDSVTNTLTFEILNIGEDDVVGLVAEIPKQDNVVVKGANKNIIGDLDANDDTTFKYEASPKDGEIVLELAYTDAIDERRHMEKKVYFDSSYFTNRKADQAKARSGYFYLFYLLLFGILGVWGRRWWKKRKAKKEKK